MDTAYLAAATALLWAGLYFLPIGSPLFRPALPLPLILWQLRNGGRCAVEGVAVSVLLLIALMGPVRGPLMLFPFGLLALWLGWAWRRGCSWWLSLSLAALIGTAGFLVRVAVLSVLVGENLWVLLISVAAGLLDRLASLVGSAVSFDLGVVQLVAVVLLLVQNFLVSLCQHAVAYWIFPRLQAPIPEPPPALQSLVALDPL